MKLEYNMLNNCLVLIFLCDEKEIGFVTKNFSLFIYSIHWSNKNGLLCKLLDLSYLRNYIAVYNFETKATNYPD